MDGEEVVWEHKDKVDPVFVQNQQLVRKTSFYKLDYFGPSHRFIPLRLPRSIADQPAPGIEFNPYGIMADIPPIPAVENGNALKKMAIFIGNFLIFYMFFTLQSWHKDLTRQRQQLLQPLGTDL
jgi:hypothetical protein